MLKGKIDYTYTTGALLEHWEHHQEAHPSSYGMFWCMTATGFYRIFSRENMKEFLFRLSIALYSMNLLENWLINDRLFNFKIGKQYHLMTIHDIGNHFGFEAYDSYLDSNTREEFLSGVGQGILNASIMGVFGEFSVLPIEEKDSGEKILPGEKSAPEITDKIIKKAEFFASDLMKFIPGEILDNPSVALLEKQKELEKRREALKNMPVFDINKIPEKIILTCLKYIYTDEYAEELMANPVYFEKDAKPYLYLAWLYANNLLVYGDWGYQPAEGVHLDYEDYPLEDGGINLNETLSSMDLDKIEPLLRGLF